MPPAEQYNVGCYLIDRLAEIGVDHLFGVPGDYNLRFLDDVEAADNIEWVGCANELNSAYAADGYARVRRVGALLTTYGVGELSALNGVAGAAAERLPVIHVVGGPNVADMNGRKMMHHSLGDGVFDHFSRMSGELSCAEATLFPENAEQEIDRVITEVLYHKMPGYLMIPKDVFTLPAKAPAAPLKPRAAEFSEESFKAFKAAAEELLKAAKKPAALVGFLCDRYNCNAPAEKMVNEGNFPFAHMLLGKGALDEQSSKYIGCYFGSTCQDSVRKTIEDADALVMLGVKFHDFGTGYFSQKIDAKRTIDIQPFATRIGDALFQQIPMQKAIEAVTELALQHNAQWPKSHPKPPPFDDAPSDKWCAHHFWSEVQQGLAPGDIIICDQGTSSAAGAGLVLPSKATFLVQCLWGSIGYSIPAAFGAQMADKSRRVILSVGDGSAQLTLQEWGSFLRHDLHPLVFLINNDGYVIERVIHGWNAVYNDIAPYNWTALIKALSADKEPQTMTVREQGKVQQLVKDTQQKRDKLYFSEIMLGRHEVPIVPLGWKPN